MLESAVNKLWAEKYRPKKVSDCILPKEVKETLQKFVEQGDTPNLILHSNGAGMGKAQPLTSKVLTPNGYVYMGDVYEGMVVLDGKGNHTMVTGVYPQGKRDIYRIHFVDKTYIEVSDEHLNSVYLFNRKDKSVDEHVVTTLELIEMFKQYGTNLRVDVPRIRGRKYHDMEYPLILGMTVGTGEVEKRRFTERELMASYEQRVELVRGMMVTNTKWEGGYAYWETKCPTLSEQFAFLARSVGCVDTISLRKDRYVHKMTVIKALVPDGKKSSYPARNITGIEFVREDECQCIMVSSDLHTYITDNVTPTHNTTVARALCDELGYDTIFINASLENGIDVLRNKIMQFVSTQSLTANMKCVILDEADGLSQTAFQPALRGFIEEFSQDVRFILTCNYLNKILPPIQSRCTCLSFETPATEKKALMKEGFHRVIEILKKEGVEYDAKTVMKILVKHYPDMRRTLNELQRYSAGGKISDDVVVSLDVDDIETLVGFLKNRQFTEMRHWVGTNKNMSPEKVYRWMYDNATKFLKPESVPQLVMTSAEYQYKTAFVVDQEINMCAYFTELMLNCEFL